MRCTDAFEVFTLSRSFKLVGTPSYSLDFGLDAYILALGRVSAFSPHSEGCFHPSGCV